MTIGDKIKGIFHSGHTEPHATGTTTEQRTIRDPDPHVSAGTAAGHNLDTQRHHASTMPQPDMESEVWPDVHGKYREASKEARLTNQNAKLAEEELEKLRLAQSQATDATTRQQQLKEEAARAHQQFGQFDSKKDEAARAATAARQREAQVGQLSQEAEAAKRAAMEKQRAAQGLGPEGQAAERTLQATMTEIEANKRRAAELQQKQTQLEQQRLEAERNTGRHAQALAQEKQKIGALEQQLQAARARIHDGEGQLNHLHSIEAEIANKIRQLGGEESPMQALRKLEAHHNGLVQRATAAQAALEEHRRTQQARAQEARAAEEHYKGLLSRLDPANAEVQRAKEAAARLANEARENEARAHQLAQHHQGVMGEVEKHTRTLTQARTDAEKHMQLFHKYEGEAEAAHGRKQERWGEANDLVGQMGQSETTKFGTMQDKIKNFGSKLLHGGQATGTGTTTTTNEHHTATQGIPGQTTTTRHSSTTGGPIQRTEQHMEQRMAPGTGATTTTTGAKTPGAVGMGGRPVVAEE
ncbi:hypothetical protein WJX81_002692 [Elliptochloris bilobata]|uniref:Uncharacterized protein n=1 Tax=Elliptochloris bilobata TaxID=381761 RepID=A0AAW1S8P0_9CHLO